MDGSRAGRRGRGKGRALQTISGSGQKAGAGLARDGL